MGYFLCYDICAAARHAGQGPKASLKGLIREEQDGMRRIAKELNVLWVELKARTLAIPIESEVLILLPLLLNKDD